MQTIKREFRLSFDTSLDGVLTIRIPRPNTSATNDMVREAMDRIIESNAVESTAGRPTQRNSAIISETIKTPFLLGEPWVSQG